MSSSGPICSSWARWRDFLQAFSDRILCKRLMENNGECFHKIVEFDGFFFRFMYNVFAGSPMNTGNSDCPNYVTGVQKRIEKT